MNTVINICAQKNRGLFDPLSKCTISSLVVHMSITIGFVLYILNVHSKVIAKKKIQEYACKQTVSIHTAQWALTPSRK